MTTAASPVMNVTRGPVPDARRVGDPAPGRVGPGTPDDNALMAAIAAGDAAALDQLYLRYRSTALAAAHTLLREPCAAEDATHEAFLRVWQAAATFRADRGSHRAWLLTIVRNVAMDILRARQVALRLQPARALAENHGEGDEDIPTRVAAAADARRLRAALKTLPPAQRHAVELAFFAGLTHGEIAARTGIPLGTVKGRVRLGLLHLRHDLRDLAPPARRQMALSST
ncbi:MAG: RNA polymerase sigma factor [Thermomicrobiales bacterium]